MTHLYLRLIETEEPTGLDRLAALERALASVPEVKLLYPPRLDGGGAIAIHLELPESFDRSLLPIRLEELGYNAVF